VVTVPKSGTEPFLKGVETSMSSSSSFLSTSLQRIMLYGLIIFAVVPLALGLLLFIEANGLTIVFLTIYYVFVILGLAGIIFERLANEIRKPHRPTI
jgi:hypothetical protein